MKFDEIVIKLGRATTVIVVAIAAAILSLLITASAIVLLQQFGLWQLPVKSWYLALGLSALVAAVVAPLVTWQLVNMVFRIHELKNELRQLATFDSLTGLLNRGALLTNANQLHELAIRESKPITLILLDLDHFKVVNDSFGHAAGDIVLKSFGAMLSDMVRGSDLVGRIGGEEFLVCLYGIDSQAVANYCDKLVHAARQQAYFFAGQRFDVTVSAGVAHGKGSHLTIGQLIQHADLALYQAKREGRNQWRLYTASERDKKAVWNV